MKMALISDLHFGAKQNSDVFLDKMCMCLDTFLEYVRANEIGAVVIAGDVFESKHVVNIKVMNKSIKFVEDLSGLSLPVYMLLGNHDVYYTTQNNFNSLKIFREFKNVFVIEDEPFSFGDILLVPWVNDRDRFLESKVIEGHEQTCIGHFDIKGFPMYNGAMLSENGLPAEIFYRNFKQTFSGHFHTRSDKTYDGYGRISFIGSPYQLTRSDKGDERGFCVFDTETLDVEFLNLPGAKHIDIKYPEEPGGLITGNIVDIYVDYADKFSELDLSTYIDKIVKLRPMFPPEIKVVNKTELNLNEKLADAEFGSTVVLIEKYINGQEEMEHKKEVHELMLELYKESGGENE